MDMAMVSLPLVLLLKSFIYGEEARVVGHIVKLSGLGPPKNAWQVECFAVVLMSRYIKDFVIHILSVLRLKKLKNRGEGIAHPTLYEI